MNQAERVTDPPLIFERTPIEGDVLLCPHFRCVTCGKPITDPDAIVVKPYGDHGPDGTFLVAHIGECDRFRGSGWDHLDDFLCHLFFNSRIDAYRLRRLLEAVEEREAQEGER
jgi:hypothetical protein